VKIVEATKKFSVIIGSDDALQRQMTHFSRALGLARELTDAQTIPIHTHTE
jgi:hypothetical protein